MVVTRKRKIRQYVNQVAAENRKSETILKKVKEQAAKKLSLWIRSIAPKVGGMLAAVALILAVVALPTLSMVTIIYNSPLAIFFPPVEEGDTVQSVIQTRITVPAVIIMIAVSLRFMHGKQPERISVIRAQTLQHQKRRAWKQQAK